MVQNGGILDNKNLSSKYGCDNWMCVGGARRGANLAAVAQEETVELLRGEVRFSLFL